MQKKTKNCRLYVSEKIKVREIRVKALSKAWKIQSLQEHLVCVQGSLQLLSAMISVTFNQ